MFKTTASSEFPESPHSGMKRSSDEVGVAMQASSRLSAKPSKSFNTLKDTPSLHAWGVFTFIVYAHEEGVSTGSDAWLGPLLFLAIIFLSILLGKVVTHNRSNKSKEVRKDD